MPATAANRAAGPAEGDHWHGIVTLIVVVIVMRLVEELVVRFHRKLA